MIERKKPRKRKPRIGHRRVSGIKVYENHHSNTPRSRGGISKALEKYTTLAQDASSNGDRILAENFFQYAEHYQRLLNEGVGFDVKKNNNNNYENFDYNYFRRIDLSLLMLILRSQLLMIRCHP